MLISTLLDKIDGAVFVVAKSSTGNIACIGPAETSGEEAIDCEGPTVEQNYTCFFLLFF